MTVLRCRSRINKIVFIGVILLVLFSLVALCSVVMILVNKQVTKDYMTNIDSQGLYCAEQIKKELSVKYDVTQNLTDILVAAMKRLGSSFTFNDVINIINIYYHNEHNEHCAGYWVYLHSDLFSSDDYMPYINNEEKIGEYVLYSIGLVEKQVKSEVLFKNKITKDVLFNSQVFEKPYISDPYISNGNYIISLSFPVYLNGRVAGAVGIDLKISEIDRMIHDIDIASQGYARLVSDNYLILADVRGIDYVGKSLIDDKELLKLAASVGNKQKYSLFSENSITGDKDYRLVLPVEISDSGIYWILEIVIFEKIIAQQVMTTLSIVIEVAVLVMIFAVGVAVLFGFFVNKSVTLESSWYRLVLDSIQFPVFILNDKRKICFENKAAMKYKSNSNSFKEYYDKLSLCISSGDKSASFIAELESLSDNRWNLQWRNINDRQGKVIGEIILFNSSSFNNKVQRVVNTLKVLLEVMSEEEKMRLDKLTDVVYKLETKVAKLNQLNIIYELPEVESEQEKFFLNSDIAIYKIDTVELIIDDIRSLGAKLNMIKLNMTVITEENNIFIQEITKLVEKIDSMENSIESILTRFTFLSEQINEFVQKKYICLSKLSHEIKSLENELGYIKNITKEVRQVSLKRLKDYEHIQFELKTIDAK